MDIRTKTDLRRAPTPPRPAIPRPRATGEEEHALLFGETGSETETDFQAPPVSPEDAE